MKKININIRFLYERTRNLLLNSGAEWSIIEDEYHNEKQLFKNYLIPLSAIVSLGVLLLSFFHYTIVDTLLYALINFVSTTMGTYLGYLIIREYLNNKISDAYNTALYLTVYSSAIFIVFHSLSVAFVSGFLSQLTGLISLIFIRTLYVGIARTKGIPAGIKTNTLIIMALSIICIPTITKKLLMIIFHIPVFNI